MIGVYKSLPLNRPKTILSFVSMLMSLLFCMPLLSVAQHIKGEVIDMENKKPIGEVSIENIYNNSTVASDKEGKFEINARSGELLEFKRAGYKTTHVRVPNGDMPSYFKIILEHFWAPQVYAIHDWKYDSTAEYELYKHELEFPRMTGLDIIQHPFSAMDKRNQEIWAFQDMYAATQEEKYIDYTFNKQLVTKLTGLQGDSLSMYMKRYRPTYGQLRNMSDYNFYGYVRKTVAIYRKGGSSSGRLSH